METRLLKKVTLFNSLGEKELEKIVSLTSLHKYKKESIIFMEAEAGNSLFIISKGRVKISRISDEGKEVILAILKEDDFFGEMSLLDGHVRSANVTAIEDSELLRLRRDDFFNLLQSHPELSINLLKELAKRIRMSDTQIKSLSLLDAVGRVASAVIQLVEIGGTIKEGKMVIEKLPSQQDLANMAGTSRETVSRAFKLFIDEGYIVKKGNKIIIEKSEKFKRFYE